MHRLKAAAVMLVALGALPADAAGTAPYARKALALSTPWTDSVSTTAPLPEYPRPQLRRRDWLSLNGRWQYEPADSEQAPPFGHELAETILVPFPMQSPLSGIERGDQAGWYRRTFRVPPRWGSRRILLNFGAIAWATSVYVNGRLAGSHRGDYDSFSLDITSLVNRSGPNELLVGYADPIGGAAEPVGKQTGGHPSGIYHTASSGIWQTVWLEPVAAHHLTRLDLRPDLLHSRLIVTAAVSRPGGRSGGDGQLRVIAEAMAGGRLVADASGPADRPFPLRIAHPRRWSPSRPYLYGLRVRVVDGGKPVDVVRSYFAMRSISLGRAGGAVRILLNGRFVFQAGALFQGYWPDGVYTAPTDAALRFDIIAAKQLGYNMLRVHVAVEPDRWYYWADRLGILVWQDMPNLPVVDPQRPTAEAKAEFRRELSAIVSQRRSHPSIVTWIPFNEGWGQFDLVGIARLIRRLDSSRLIDAQSGSANCCAAIESPASDVRDAHLYFGPFAVPPDRRASVLGEYGSVLPVPPPGDRWPGVPTAVGSPVLFLRLADVAALLREQYAALSEEMRLRGLSAAVFTELTACEQELGIVSYDRRVFTLPPALVQRLNMSLVAASQQPASLRPQAPAIPAGTIGLWRFDEGRGRRALDASGHGHALTLRAGASWTRGVHGGALLLTRLGDRAVAIAPVIDTGRSFTVSAWLRSRRLDVSGTAVSEPGSSGPSFSLGIGIAGPGAQERAGAIASGRPPRSPRTWWTFVVPSGPSCQSPACGVQASMHYDDGRYAPGPGSWHLVTGVYEARGRTTAIYVDGIPEDFEPAPAVPGARGSLTVGGPLNGSRADGFVGAIDELRTYARALTPDQVWRLYLAEH